MDWILDDTKEVWLIFLDNRGCGYVGVYPFYSEDECWREGVCIHAYIYIYVNFLTYPFIYFIGIKQI